ncbi:hypothetical protein C8A05DRAFT_43909 [Staphylotrichum tortipilum]|uniref:Uncharacterized protein n=1 Tax=Staphylotrichum tortipilum TaxID=2831512 RepID=A0AAN6MM24_9PEZI|nr:hypothetical protein C8A05DRAFT_43909 [Staphylotrichum longicolle]
MRAGRGNIGKVEVDCRFMFTKSRWGVMGERQNPAGILYLDLDFSQPADCRLESATVTVTLTEDDGEEGGGLESLVQTRKVKNRTPEVQVLGYGAGGLGQNKEKVVQTRGRWDFSGYISSTKDSVWYNRLRWELKENSLEWQPTHNNLFYTAFAIQHNATRFYMTVHVSGKLAKLSDRIKGRLKFGDKGGRDEEIVTKIEWTDGYSCPSRLDEMAQYLHETMGMANMSMVPVEIPGALAASYHPAIPMGRPQHGQEQPPPMPKPAPAPDSLPADLGPEGSLLGTGDPMQHLPMLTLAELRLAAASLAHGSAHLHGPLPGPPQGPPQPPRLPPLRTTPATARSAAADTEEGSEGSLSSTTLVDSAMGTTQVAEEKECLGSENEADAWQDDSGGEEQTKEEEEEEGKGRPGNRAAGGTGIRAWLGPMGVATILLRWLGMAGMFLLWLVAVEGDGPARVGASDPEEERGNRGKAKSPASGDASESSATRAKIKQLDYHARRGPRGRRGRRASLRDPKGGRARRKSSSVLGGVCM